MTKKTNYHPIRWEAVFFDFDGVILDSVHVKTRAFAEMFEKYGPEIQNKVVTYHLENGGVSRFEKFRYFYEKVLNVPIDKNKIHELSKEFSNLVFEKVIQSPFVDGAMETLEYLLKKKIPAYVVSGTPDFEIKLIVEKKGLNRYFKEVHGSPKKKEDITRNILIRKNYAPENCIFIGDALSDYIVATKTGMHFLGIVLNNSSSPFPPDTITANSIYL